MEEKNSIDIDYFLLSIACKKFNSNSGVHFWNICKHSAKSLVHQNRLAFHTLSRMSTMEGDGKKRSRYCNHFIWITEVNLFNQEI